MNKCYIKHLMKEKYKNQSIININNEIERLTYETINKEKR